MLCPRCGKHEATHQFKGQPVCVYCEEFLWVLREDAREYPEHEREDEDEEDDDESR